MSIFEESKALADLARYERVNQASQKANEQKITNGTYLGIASDGTAIVQQDGQAGATSGYVLTSNKSMSIGDRVQMRPSSGGLQRVDAKNVNAKKWKCVDGVCVEDPNGRYSSLSECESRFVITPPPFTGGQCDTLYLIINSFTYDQTDLSVSPPITTRFTETPLPFTGIGKIVDFYLKRNANNGYDGFYVYSRKGLPPWTDINYADDTPLGDSKFEHFLGETLISNNPPDPLVSFNLISVEYRVERLDGQPDLCGNREPIKSCPI